MDHNGKNYFITGITSGVGKSVAENLLRSGANIYSLVRDKTKVFDKKINTYELNLEEVGKIEHALNFLLKDTELNGILLCAGIEDTIPFRQGSHDKILKIFNINFFSNYEILRILHKKKFLCNNSSIVMISSIMSEYGSPGKTAYSASKAALNGLAKSLALELAPRNITVNCIAPGLIKTRMGENLLKNLSEENRLLLNESHPIGFSKPEEISAFMVFLLSNNCQTMTGQIIKVDGGYSVR